MEWLIGLAVLVAMTWVVLAVRRTKRDMAKDRFAAERQQRLSVTRSSASYSPSPFMTASQSSRSPDNDRLLDTDDVAEAFANALRTERLVEPEAPRASEPPAPVHVPVDHTPPAHSTPFHPHIEHSSHYPHHDPTPSYDHSSHTSHDSGYSHSDHSSSSDYSHHDSGGGWDGGGGHHD